MVLMSRSRRVTYIASSLKSRIIDIEYYVAMLESCACTTNLSQLTQAHARLFKLGVSHIDFIRTKLIYSYATCMQVHEAEYIFSVTNRQSTFLCNTMIKCFTSFNRFLDSINVYRQILMVSKKPNRQTFLVVLKTCRRMSAHYMGRQVHVVGLVHGFSSNTIICNALIMMYSKCGDLITARQMFDPTTERNFITWSAMIVGYGMHEISNEVFELFEEMLIKVVNPDGILFTTVLMACSHSGLMDMGRKFFEMMKGRFRVKLGLEHYMCIVDMLGRAGHLEEVEVLILGMEMEPNSAFWGALLGVCKIHGKVEVAERIAEKFYESSRSS